MLSVSVIAIVKSVVGQVVIESAGDGPRMLIEGDQLHSNDQLLTGANGAVTLALLDGRTLALGQDSR